MKLLSKNIVILNGFKEVKMDKLRPDFGIKEIILFCPKCGKELITNICDKCGQEIDLKSFNVEIDINPEEIL